MNVLLIGSGGREHALAWKIAASPLVSRLICAPGNAGIAQECEVAALDTADHAAVIAFCRAQAIDFVVVGPETPLCAGIVDDLAAAGIKLDEGPAADQKLRELSEMYEPYLGALAEFLLMPLPSWLPHERVADNWERMR